MMVRIKGDEKESGNEFRDLMSGFLEGGGKLLGCGSGSEAK